MKEAESMFYLKEREELLRTAREIYDNHLVAGTWGNVSLKIPDNDHILITPSGLDYRTMQTGDVMLINIRGDVVEGKWKPSTETPLHTAIYQKRPDVKAIVHVHSTFASVFSVLHQSIPVILEETAQVIGHRIETAAYAACGTQQLADQVAEALGEHKVAVLMANHGLVGVGENLAAALRVCYITEKTAQIAVYAQNIGNINELNPEETELLHKKFQVYGVKK